PGRRIHVELGARRHQGRRAPLSAHGEFRPESTAGTLTARMSPTRARRTWPQRLTLTPVINVAIAYFGAAGVLASGQWVLSQRRLVTLDAPTGEAGEAGLPEVVVPGGPTTTAAPQGDDGPDDDHDDEATDLELGDAEPEAANFLITGADNG